MRAVIIYAALLGVAMVGSYLTWTADEETRTVDDRAIAVYRADAGDVSKIFFDSEKLKVTVERRKDAKGEYPWITIDETKETTIVPTHDHEGEDHEGDDAPDGNDTPEGDDAPEQGPEAPPEPPPEPEVQVEQIHKEFRGNDNAEGLLSAFEPLMALRELDPNSASPEVFGFEEPSGEITVSRSGGEVKLVLGGETYGSRDRYAKQGERLLLLDSTAIKPLQFAASRTIERRVQPWAEADLDTITVKNAKGELELTQKNKADRKAAFWTRNGADADDVANSWVAKATRGRADQHGEASDIDGLSSVLTITLVNGADNHVLEFFKNADEDVYVRSDFLRGIAKLKTSDAVELLNEADELFQE